MATCPNCGTSSRSDPAAMQVSEVLSVPDTFPLNASLAGAQMKASATLTLRLACGCGWSILGRLEGDTFVGAPATQRWPSGRPGGTPNPGTPDRID